jgi:hypothetical protein
VGVFISFLLRRMTHESIPSNSSICMIRSKLLCLVFDTPNTKCLILVGPSGDFVYNGRCMDKILSIRLALRGVTNDDIFAPASTIHAAFLAILIFFRLPMTAPWMGDPEYFSGIHGVFADVSLFILHEMNIAEKCILSL